MKCVECGHDNPSEAVFCMKCGAKLERTCLKCGAKYTEEALFCMKCGARLGVGTATPSTDRTVPKLEDMQDQLQSRIPQSLADRLFVGAKEMQGEHKLVTAIFADLAGSSGMAREMPLDEYVEIMNDCFKMIVDIISISYEGSINRFIGDCVLAFFGAPITHENDAERAVLAALDIRDSVKELGLSVSIGINTGMTYVGKMGSDLIYSESSAWGPDVDFAKRLQEAASPGDIYVGLSTYRLTSRTFEFGEAAKIEVEGKMDQCQVAYPVLQVREHPEKLRGIEGLKARMIGRESEYTALINCADALLAERRGQIATIVGEAGIGKSRLALELREYIEGKGVRWLEGRCLSIGQSVSLWPFIDMMRTYLCISSDDNEKEIADKLIREITSLFGQEAEGIIPYVGNMLSIRLDEAYQERLRYAAPEQIRRQMLLRMRDVFVALARRQPLILVLEDMHWADDLSLDLLWVLMDELVAAPMLLLCVYRPERDHGSWQIDGVASSKHLERYTRIPLRPLTHQQTQQMIESLLNIDNLPDETREVILERTEGNPFFVEEVIRLLIDQGAIYHENGLWKAKEAIRYLAVPNTIQSVLLSRIDRLQQEVKYVLQCAAVIGRVFQHRLLGYIAGKEESMEKCLSQLEASELVYKERIVPELEYAFKHALTQETTYQRMLTRQRRAFHERIGEGIEMLYKDQIQEYYEQLAYHYGRSGNNGKAAEYLFKAGQKAAGRYANQEALDYFRQALERTEAGENYVDILRHRAKLLLSIFRGEEAANDYEQMLERAGKTNDRKLELESILGLASAYYVIALDAQEPDAIHRFRELHEEAYELACALGDKASMAQALIPTQRFPYFWPDYREQARTNLEHALTLSQELGDEELILDSRIALLGYGYTPDHKATEDAAELIRLLEPRHDLIRISEVYWRLMWVHRSLGNFEKAVECCDTGIHLAEEVGAPPVQYPTLKACALMKLGRYDVAWESLQMEVTGEEHPFGNAIKDHGTGLYFTELMAYEKASEMFESVIQQAGQLNRGWLEGWAETMLAWSLVKAGQHDAADMDEIAQNLADMFTTIPDSAKAEIDFSAGRLDEALQQVRKNCSQAQESGHRPSYIDGLELQLRILLRMGKSEDAAAVADEGIRMAEEIGYLPSLWRLHAAKAEASEMLGNDEEAAQEYGAAAAIIRRLADTIPHTELRQGFLGDPAVSSVISASNRHTGKEME